MVNETDIKIKYRKWPLFLVFYPVFAFLYFFVFYSWSDIIYRNIAETIVMTISISTFPLLAYFHLRVVKIKRYKALGLDLLFSWLISVFVVYLLMLSYIKDMEWFGAIAFYFFYTCYFLFFLLITYLIHRIKRSNARNQEHNH